MIGRFFDTLIRKITNTENSFKVWIYVLVFALCSAILIAGTILCWFFSGLLLTFVVYVITDSDKLSGVTFLLYSITTLIVLLASMMRK